MTQANIFANVPNDKTSQTDDERIRNVIPLPSPGELDQVFSCSGNAYRKIDRRYPQSSKGYTSGKIG